MTASIRNLLIALVAALALSSAGSEAAEIRLLDRVTIDGSMVHLGDIAELYGAPEAVTDRLADIQLFPAPSSKRETVVSGRRVMDILVRRGVNFNEHRISGSNRITLMPAIAATRSSRSRSQVTLRRDEVADTKSVVEASIVRLLRRKTETRAADAGEWELDFNLTPQQAAWVHESGDHFSVSGGVQPFTGRQKFDVATVSAEEEVRHFTVTAQVARPRLVVVAVQDLPRGTVVLESDVTLAKLTDKNTSRAVATTIDEVVGKETTNSIRADKPILTREVREPILVKRGELVTVIAVSGGIRVRTQGKARENGSLNQLIAIESVGKKRKSFQARVSDLQEVQVYAGAIASR